MGRYSDLRWKIADFEKQLEEEKICTKRAWEQVEHYIRIIYAQDETIKELKQIISALKVGDIANECKYCVDGICVNADCPLRADYCPVLDTEEVCRWEDRSKDDG